MAQDSTRRPKVEPDPKGAAEPQDEHRIFNTMVGETIRRARQEHSWTQAVLAERAGLSPNYIARLERGELGPSLFVANRICDALDIEIDELVGGGGKRAMTRRRAAG